MASFAEEFATKLMSKINNDDLKLVIRELELHCANYNMERISREVSVYVDYVPACLKHFLVGRMIAGMSNGTISLDKNYITDAFVNIRKNIEDITGNDIKLYLYNLQQRRGISNRTLDTHRSVLSVFFKWAQNEGYIAKNPMANIQRIKFEVKARKPLSDEELEKVRMACRTTRERALIEFLYSTGCRVAELARLDWKDVDFREGEVHLFGKGKKHRTSYLNAKATLMLCQYITERQDDNVAVFVSTKGTNERLTVRGVQRIIHGIGERSGIGRKLFPHLIRHTTATNLLQHGMAITEVQKILGHECINTTLIYAKVDAHQLKVDHKKYIA